MSWFKIDDGWWSHPKTLGLSSDAVALWARAGSWSCQHLTDGFIPDYALKAFGVLPKVAAELVKVGYWDVVEGGWTFHDWADYQERSEVVKKRRDTARERMRTVRANNTRTDDGGSPEVRSTPSRPVPTRPTQTVNESSQVLNAPEIDLTKIISAVQKNCGRDCSKADAFLIVGTVMSRTKEKVKSSTAFVVRAIENDPFEFQKLLDESGAVAS